MPAGLLHAVSVTQLVIFFGVDVKVLRNWNYAIPEGSIVLGEELNRKQNPLAVFDGCLESARPSAD